ncbi:2Fe-2S iron-sulfur cluster binding domain-containing protein [Variovorax paradoxus]|nr:2Fe-2S iron-sulfur cluster binding domain-containing protein [Variovorax paradoxus]
MPNITFIEFNGARHTVEASVGQSLMKAAVSNSVPGIDAECGGACACATCHVYIADDWLAHIGDPIGNEKEMLDFANEVQPNSRLACQISIRPDMDGLVVSMPASQS